MRGGGGMSSELVIGAATGFLKTIDKTGKKDHLTLDRFWAHSLLRRMNFVQRKATTAASKYSRDDFAERKEEFLTDLVDTVVMEEIPPELILNWDQTGIKIVPSYSWTMAEMGSRRVELVGLSDKRQITAVFCGSLLGDFLPLQLIYKGKTRRCHPKYEFPLDWHITHSPNHWSNEDTMIQYVENIIVPFVNRTRDLLGEEKSALIIMDNFKGQVTQKMTTLLENHHIHTCLLPPNTTDRLQPMDISVNKPAKAFLRQQFQTWYGTEIAAQVGGENPEDIDGHDLHPVDLSMTVMKEIGAQWLKNMADYISSNPQFIVNGFI